MTVPERSGALLAALVAILGTLATTLVLTFVMRGHAGFTPLATAAAFLPLIACTMIAAKTIPARLLPVAGPKPLLTIGLLLCAGAQFWLSYLGDDATYALHLLGPLVLMGLGLGTAISTAIHIATVGVARRGGTTRTQIGGSVDVAVISSVVGAAATSLYDAPFGVASMDEEGLAFGVSAAIFLATAMIESFLLPDTHADPDVHLSQGR